MEYLLKVSAVVAIFYISYKLFLQRDTFFESNRWFLIIGLLSSLMIPFLVIPIYIEYTPVDLSDFTINEQISTENIEKPFSILDYLPIIYGLGVAFFSIRFFIQFISLATLILKNKGLKKENFVFIETETNILPFSFFNWIVYNPEKFNPTELEQIITHEKVHAKQYHSLDILITHLSCIVLWFNPFIWFYHKDLKQNLEFIADRKTVKEYNCKKSYQYTLLKTSMPSHQMALSNHFYNSLIKKRIVMLQKSKSKKINLLKYALVIPIIALFLMSFNTEEVFIEKDIKPNKNTSIIINDDILISGTITDEKGKPISGAMILNGSNSGVMTNNEGQYKIKADIDDELIFSYKGMQTQNIKVTDNAPINVKLSKAIRLKGLQTSSGEPPLYIINGKEVTENIAKAINPDNIESITVLKDEDAIKKYGDKGKNGVVLMTLKETTKLTSEVKVIGYKTKSDTITYKIKGISSVNGASPLIIIDGKELSQEELEKLNPNTIKSMIVLNDETATKKYEDKGKNGVIEITSKENTKIVAGKPMNDVKIIGYSKVSDSVISIEMKNGDSANKGIIYKNSKMSLNGNAILNLKKGKNYLVIINGKEKTLDDATSLTPENIESINYLEDKSATKKYGKKGKNGVIEITTKK